MPARRPRGQEKTREPKKEKQPQHPRVDALSHLPPPPPPPPARMFSGVGCFWVLLSSCLVAVCSFSFLSPAWIVKERAGGAGNGAAGGGGGGSRRLVVVVVGGAPQGEGGGGPQEVSFGLLWHCPTGPPGPRGQDCYAFGGLARFQEIPSGSWQTSAVLCAGGCALLAISSLLAVVVLFLPSGPCERRICTLAGYIQMAAVFIMGFGLLVYPFGLASATVRRHCEEAGIYYAGDCQIGWGYMLAIVGVMLSVFLPFFAKYAPKEQASPTPIPTIL